MKMKLSNDFNEISQEEMQDVEGGVLLEAVVGGYISYRVVKHLYELGYQNGYHSVKAK